MRIVHIVAEMEQTNGVSVSVAHIANVQAATKHQVEIVTSYNDGSFVHLLNDVRIMVFPAAVRSIRFSFQLAIGIYKACKDADVVHVHCAWTFPVWWGAWCAKRNHAKLIVSPHGSYDPARLAYHSLRKRLVAWLDRRVLRSATTVHSVSQIEREWISSFEPHIQRHIVSPLGVEVCPGLTKNDNDDVRTFLYLGRIHPLKGLDMLIAAWRLFEAAVSSQHNVSARRCRLVIAGPDEQGTLGKLKILADGLDIEFSDPVYGDEKRQLMVASDVLILPSKSENFGLVVAESLAAGLPVVCTDILPWQGVRTHHCGWAVPATVDGLAAALQEAATLPKQELSQMGERGRDWMRRDFSWDKCASALLG